MSRSTPTPNPSTQPIRYNLDCQNGGKTVQLCTDSNFNIKQCDDSSGLYRYNTVLCNCDDTSYSSQADSTMKPYKGRYCQFSDNTTCNGKGIVKYSGKCDCNQGFFGDRCQFSTITNCNGRGTPVLNADGTVFLSCKDCVDSVGDRCQYTRQNTCNGHGNVSLDSNGNAKCNCDQGWGGGMCKYDNSRCNNNGTIDPIEDKCRCKDGFRTVNMQTEWIDKGKPTPLPRPTGYCNDCESGRGPWKPGSPESCRWTWVERRSRLTNDCYYRVGGNCGDRNIMNIRNRGPKIHSLADRKDQIVNGIHIITGDNTDAGFLQECDTTHGGACECTSGYNTQRCHVTGYFEPSEQDEGCKNDARGGYSCVWGSGG